MVVSTKNGGTFHSSRKKELGELLAKNIARTARIQLDGRTPAIWRIFAELDNPLSSKFAGKQAT